MKSMPRSCVNCSSYDSASTCSILASRSRPHASENACQNHSQFESDALDTAIHALWEPLLIKSRWAAERSSKGRRN